MPSTAPTLALALMAGPSRAGSWCAVVGVTDFGVEAASALGVDLARTVVVPEPGEQWLEVTAALGRRRLRGGGPPDRTGHRARRPRSSAPGCASARLCWSPRNVRRGSGRAARCG